MDLNERIKRNISPEPNSGCWLWLGPADKAGYGRVLGKHRMAHRIVYELLRGPIPPGLELDHLCRVRCCVNPQHLEPVTRSVNLKRGLFVGKANLRKTHCPKGHPYDSANTYTYNGMRFCRECSRSRKSKHL